MKREILEHKTMKHISGCCPGHDDYPSSTYSSRRSKRARSKGIKKEHKAARSIGKRFLTAQQENNDD